MTAEVNGGQQILIELGKYFSFCGCEISARAGLCFGVEIQQLAFLIVDDFSSAFPAPLLEDPFGLFSIDSELHSRNLEY